MNAGRALRKCLRGTLFAVFKLIFSFFLETCSEKLEVLNKQHRLDAGPTGEPAGSFGHSNCFGFSKFEVRTVQSCSLLVDFY